MTVPSQGIYYSLLRTQVSDPSVKALGAKLSHFDDALGENKGASKVTWVLTVQGTFDGHGVGAFDRKLHIPSPPGTVNSEPSGPLMMSSMEEPGRFQ